MAVAAAAVVLLAPGVAVGQPAAGDDTVLAPGLSVEGELRGTRTRRLRLSAAPGSFVRLRLDLEREDARLRILDPTGEVVAVRDGSVGLTPAHVEVSFLTELAGDYALEMSPRLSRAPPLRFRLRVEELRPAAPADAARVAAERRFTRAIRLRREPDHARLVKARALLHEALAAWSELDNPSAVAAARTQLGFVLAHLRPSRGVSLCRQALEEWRRIGSPDGAALALDCLGDCQLRRWDLAAAEASYEEMRSLAVASRRLGTEARALEQLGWIAIFTDKPEAAVATLERTLTLQRQRGDVRGEARALIRVGAALSRAGRHQEGLDRFREAIDTARKVDADHLVLLALGGTGRIYSGLGDLDRALASQRERLTLARKLRRRDQEANTLLTLGVIHSRSGHHRDALDAQRQALRIVEQPSRPWPEAVAHTNIAESLVALDRHREAIPHLHAALALARQVPDRETEARVIVGLGAVYRGLGDIARARKLLSQGRALSREVGVLDQEMRAIHLLARVERDGGNLVTASRLLDNATALAESQRARVAMDTLRVTLLARTRALYELQIEVLLALHETDARAGHAARAFATAERIKSRALFELVTLDPGAVETRLAPALRRRKEAAERRLTQLQRNYVRTASEEQSPEAELRERRSELQAAESELAEIHAHLRRRDPELAEWLDPQPLDYRQARRHLPAGSALLSYVLGERESFLFVLVEHSLTAHRLPPAGELRGLVETIHTAVSRPGSLRLKRYAERARELYRVLVAPAEARLAGVDQILISPDGALHHLPFEALLSAPPPPAAASDLARLPYLLRRWSVRYVPSASVLAALERRHSSRAARPAADAGAPALVAIAVPGSAGEKRQAVPPHAAKSTTRSVVGEEELWKLPPLPSAVDEIERISASVGRRSTRVFLGSEATERRVKTSPELASARWVHFATHSVISEPHPLYSGLVLHLDDQGDDDGLLQVYEILELSLSAEVVVLSACETARGKRVRGEGILGLSRAFLSAGAGSLVVSLWKVADTSTAELMASFYARLAAGEPGASALRQAKLDLLTDGRFAHPFYWAPFVLIGQAGTATAR